jgi:predicted transcriptional regulator
MSHVVSMRLRDDQMERLRRLARRLGRTPSETSALLLEESLREAEFAAIEFRDSPAGRQAYVTGSGLAVWEVIMVARGYDGDTERTAALLEWPVVKVKAALNYAEAFPEEIAAALADNDKGFAELKRLLPDIELIEVSDDSAGTETRPSDEQALAE